MSAIRISSRHIVLVGLSHRSAPIELREKLAFRDEELPRTLATLRREVGLQEAAVLSTCNRVEIYAGVAELNGTLGRLHQFLSDHARLELHHVAPRLYSVAEPESVRHLFAVASGLDSMVLGEGEILHQVKHAYEWARTHGGTGKLFNTLFQRALNAAKSVRTHTAIGRGCVSVGTVSVELAEKIFGHLSGSSVLLMGAGKVGELTLKRLTARGVRSVRIMNRSMDRATQLASGYQATPVPFEQLAAQLCEVDVVISSTSAPTYLLLKDQVREALRGRQQRPLCVIDLGVPRNVEPAVGTLENVYLFNVDDLQGLVDRSHRERAHAVAASQVIINQKVAHFLSWWQQELLPSHVQR